MSQSEGDLVAKVKIDELRQKVGLTQLELSRHVGVTETTIQNWESGRSGFEPIERVIRLCKALNCSVEDLIEYVECKETGLATSTTGDRDRSESKFGKRIREARDKMRKSQSSDEAVERSSDSAVR